ISARRVFIVVSFSLILISRYQHRDREKSRSRSQHAAHKCQSFWGVTWLARPQTRLLSFPVRTVGIFSPAYSVAPYAIRLAQDQLVHGWGDEGLRSLQAEGRKNR